MFADYELSHVVSPLKHLDPSSVAHRDMGIFLSRRLSIKNNPNPMFMFDNEEKHKQLPCAFSLDSKYL